MDSFYAEVEALANPGLRERPMAVGGMGMLCTANYAARQYGVRSAMPGYIALKYAAPTASVTQRSPAIK
jgi:DNA polymerase kappa